MNKVQNLNRDSDLTEEEIHDLRKRLALYFQRRNMTPFEINYYFSHYELTTLEEMFLG